MSMDHHRHPTHPSAKTAATSIIRRTEATVLYGKYTVSSCVRTHREAGAAGVVDPWSHLSRPQCASAWQGQPIDTASQATRSPACTASSRSALLPCLALPHAHSSGARSRWRVSNQYYTPRHRAGVPSHPGPRLSAGAGHRRASPYCASSHSPFLHLTERLPLRRARPHQHAARPGSWKITSGVAPTHGCCLLIIESGRASCRGVNMQLPMTLSPSRSGIPSAPCLRGADISSSITSRPTSIPPSAAR
ncbi:hypothetical protein HYPSUDRAFT_1055265 [Hypholoma sublateritium FD-334 SS-4]|uniref:Uncharacterized protein n=1 Tax=Hypholoma sublateritium (strain FD-334 SS-4) TaxID=945553 RepID=A0A0D2KQF0_HYPSF|nr:hypothetical protein HYPSUDRAFT_1055265 [Hypholoma sublateritium FD-334 SS-4]